MRRSHTIKAAQKMAMTAMQPIISPAALAFVGRDSTRHWFHSSAALHSAALGWYWVPKPVPGAGVGPDIRAVARKIASLESGPYRYRYE